MGYVSLRYWRGHQAFLIFLLLHTYFGGFSVMSDSSEAASIDTPRSTPKTLVLANGLQVVWEEDHRQPLVAIEVRIKGGLRAEGRFLGTGITHAIEHMLFKGTPSRVAGTIEQEVRRYGGTINAYTSLDTTGITLFVEGRFLQQALALLADILQNAQFDPVEFEKERAVIISEIQMNQDDPDRRILHLFWNRHLMEHPYRYPILGYRELLQRLSVNDLAEFYHVQYQPQNLVISCVGDLDGNALSDWMKSTFESWPRANVDPMQVLVANEPPAVSTKEVVEELPVQTAYVILGWSSTRLANPDLYAMDVLASILGKGSSSRFYETVVRKTRLAHGISAWNYTPYDPGIFAVQLQTDPDKVDAALDAVLKIIEDVKQNGVTPDELQKAKRQVVTDYWLGLQTVESKAADLASSLALTGNPLFSRHYVDGIQQVSQEQVQDVALRYCTATRWTKAVIHPPTARVEQSVVSQVQGGLPVTRTQLANGAVVLVGSDRTLPLATIVVAFKGGLRVETGAEQGLSHLVAQMLTQGTTNQSALEIAKRIESLGGILDVFSGRDGFGLTMQLLAEDFDEGLSLMHELLSESIFPEQEMEIQRQLIAKQLQVQEDEIFVVGGKLLRQTLFNSHPYRFDPLGDLQTIRALTRAQCMAFAKRWVVPSNMVLGVFGDVDGTHVNQRVAELFGSITAAASPWPDQLPVEPLEGIREVSRSMEKEQALIMWGFRGSTYMKPDRYALEVLTAVLSGMAGRLFQAVREEHGLSYTLGAVNVLGWDPGYLLVYAATRPEEYPKVMEVLEQQINLLLAQGLTDEEVEQAKRYLIGEHRMSLQHLAGLAKRSCMDELYGLGFNAWTEYEDRISSVSLEQVHEVARQYLTLQNRAQVIVSPNGHHPE